MIIRKKKVICSLAVSCEVFFLEKGFVRYCYKIACETVPTDFFPFLLKCNIKMNNLLIVYVFICVQFILNTVLKNLLFTMYEINQEHSFLPLLSGQW